MDIIEEEFKARFITHMINLKGEEIREYAEQVANTYWTETVNGIWNDVTPEEHAEVDISYWEY